MTKTKKSYSPRVDIRSLIESQVCSGYCVRNKKLHDLSITSITLFFNICSGNTSKALYWDSIGTTLCQSRTEANICISYLFTACLTVDSRQRTLQLCKFCCQLLSNVVFYLLIYWVLSHFYDLTILSYLFLSTLAFWLISSNRVRWDSCEKSASLIYYLIPCLLSIT